VSNRSTRLIEVIFSFKGKTVTIPSDLSIKAVVTASRVALPNSCKLEIRQLSPKTFSFIEKRPEIELKVDGQTYFTGKVYNAVNSYKAPTWKCEIYCSDIKLLPTVKKEKLLFSKGQTTGELLSSMIEKISDVKIDLNPFSNCISKDKSLLKSLVIEYRKESDIMKAIGNMFKACNKEVIKENGKVSIIDKAETTNPNTPLTLKKFISEPPRLSDKDISVTVPLNNRYRLGVGFKIDSKSIALQLKNPYTFENHLDQKIFKIVELSHSFDNHTTAVAKTVLKGIRI